MNIKLVLEKFGLVEGVDFELNVDGSLRDKLAKKRIVDQVVSHPATPPVMNGETIIEPAIPAWEEVVQVEETFFANFPSEEEMQDMHKNLCIQEFEVAVLVNEFLKDKKELRDFENDSLSIANNQINVWDFKNIPCPTRDELFALCAVIKEKNNKEAIKNEIEALEASLTPRRLREALLTGDNSFVSEVENKIIALRAKLN